MLSTPPAFIVSQDQTLMLKVDLQNKSGCWFVYQIYCFKGPNLSIGRSSNLTICLNNSLESFKVFHCSVINVLRCRYQRQLVYTITYFFICQQLFEKILNNFITGKWSAEGGIWTLAPVSRPIPLAGAPLRPLEYFCIFSNIKLFTFVTHTLLY